MQLPMYNGQLHLGAHEDVGVLILFEVFVLKSDHDVSFARYKQLAWTLLCCVP